MTVLVTGANGFVGSAVARALLERGYPVVAMVRQEAELSNLALLPVEIRVGDIRDLASISRAMQGCKAVIHVAADYRLWVRHPESMYSTNVDGTRNIIETALRQGVGRIVYTSSVATLGAAETGGESDEETPVTAEQMIGHYKRSKYLAEQVAWGLVSERDAPVVIVNPSTPLGPGDIKPTPTGRIILDAMRGRIPAFVDTGLNVVHVDDVAAGHVAALERGEVGRRYILGGENLTLQQILTRIATSTGRPPPSLKLPHSVAMAIAWLSEGVARVSGHEPRATVDGVRMSKRAMFYSSARAVRELGYRFRPASEAIDDAILWFVGSEIRKVERHA